MTIDSVLMSTGGRILNPPELQYAAGGRPMVSASHIFVLYPQAYYKQKPKTGSGSWNLVQSKLHKPQKIITWGIVSFDGSLRNDRLESFVSNLYACLVDLGM